MPIITQSLRAGMSLKMIRYAMIVLPLCLPHLAFSQAPDLQFEKYTVVDGLSQSHVTCILQDRDGFMWFGTGDGLNRYDGYTYTVWRHSAGDSMSLSHSSINVLFQDRDGRIWVGTPGGLDLYNPGEEDFVHLLSDCDVSSIVEDRGGGKWIGTRQGMWKIASDGRPIRRYTHDGSDRNALASDIIQCMTIDATGTLWIGTAASGLNTFSTEQETFSSVLLDSNPSRTTSSTSITSLLNDEGCSIWVGTSLGLIEYDRCHKKWKEYLTSATHGSRYYQNYILSLAKDSLGRLWVGTDEGLTLYDTERREVGRYYIDTSASEESSNEILSVKFSSDGTMWCGTKNGIRKHSPYANKFVTYRRMPFQNNSLVANKVWSAYVDKENILWVGTDNGLTRIDRRTHHYKHFKHDPANPASIGDDVVLSILEDRHGQLWVGTWRSLDRFDKRTGRFAHYPADPQDRLNTTNSVMMMQESEGGNLWLGALNGIHCFDPVTKRYLDEALLTNLFHDLTFGALCEDRAGNVWIGTVGKGLLKYDRARGTVAAFVRNPKDSTTLSSNFINAIHVSADDRIWIGTSEGLNLLDARSMTFVRYSAAQGLANGFVGGILEDSQGTLWLSTNGGLSRFDPRTLAIRNYDASDGLQSNEFNNWSAHFNHSGELFFGGVNGLTSFVPESLKDNPHVPPIRLTSLKVYSQGQLPNRVVRGHAAIDLSYPENTFSFEFTALDFTIPGKNQYAYMLEGFDRDWNYCARRRFATYTNLDPGTYILRIKGSNNDGIWNEAGISIPLNILPPFWKTWWFRASMIAAFTLLLSTLFYIRLRSVKRRNIVLESKVGERTRELHDANENLKSQIETRKKAERELKVYESQLEYRVREKTTELSRIVESLELEVTERKRAEQKLLEYQGQLRSLASELSITEDRERQRMAAYLHDYVGQALSMCKLKLDILRDGRRPVPIDEISGLLLQAIEHTRSLTIDLSPPILRELKFVEAIEWLTQQFQSQHNIPVSFSDDQHTKHVSADMKTFLYHTIRELLTNVIKHARASRAEVVLEQVKSDLVITVGDNGAGFDSGTFQHGNSKKSFGLFNIKERLLHFNGTLELVSRPGGGTRVVLKIPLASLHGDN